MQPKRLELQIGSPYGTSSTSAGAIAFAAEMDLNFRTVVIMAIFGEDPAATDQAYLMYCQAHEFKEAAT